MLTHQRAGLFGIARQNDVQQGLVLDMLVFQHLHRQHGGAQPDETVARRQIEQPFAHLQQILGAAAGDDGGVKRLMALVPFIE